MVFHAILRNRVVGAKNLASWRIVGMTRFWDLNRAGAVAAQRERGNEPPRVKSPHLFVHGGDFTRADAACQDFLPRERTE